MGMLEVLDRSGTGRRTLWTCGNTRFETPNILFFDSDSFPAPEFAELFLRERSGNLTVLDGSTGDHIASVNGDMKYPLTYLRDSGLFEVTEGDKACLVRAPPELMSRAVRSVSADVLVLGGAFELMRNPRELVRSIVALREAAGPSKLIYAPGIMEPENLALLTYLGVDLFDSTLICYQTAKGKILLQDGALDAEEVDWLPKDRLLEQNLLTALNELKRVRLSLKKKFLRELVEMRAVSSALGVAALRIFDLEFYQYQEKYYPVTGKKVQCNTSQSLFRPDVWRFRKRMMERYRPPEHKKVLLLLPCSAKKPYSISKTHFFFRKVIESVPNSHLVHEVIVTSPLGLVPRELELVYPAAHYDIPVTGHWDCHEVEMIQKMLSHLSLFGYEKIVCHVPQDFISDTVDCVVTCGDSPVSASSLDKLKTELENVCTELDPIPRWAGRLNDMRSLARFQFGEKGEILLEGSRITGRYPRLKIMDGDKQLGMLTPERGLISLTLEGAERLAPAGINWVRMGDFDLKGNLFAVGVLDADPNIRIGDEVIVLRGEEVVAVGTASMPPMEMLEMNRGEAVRVRHSR